MKDLFDNNDSHVRDAFAAFAMQGLLSSVEIETLNDHDNMLFIAETAFDLADLMMGIRRETTRH